MKLSFSDPPESSTRLIASSRPHCIHCGDCPEDERHLCWVGSVGNRAVWSCAGCAEDISDERAIATARARYREAV